LQGINLAALLVVLLLGGGLLAFLYGHVLLDFAWPAIGTAAVFGSIVVTTLSEADRQRRQLREQAAHMAGEVDAARRIQMGLLPDPRDAVARDGRIELAAALEPARTVGGDFYDCFHLEGGRFFFVVADVSGKGLPAALFMASVKSHLKSAALRGGSVGEILTRAQAEIARENPEQLFVTAFAAILELASGELSHANAGHEPPFIRTPSGAPERVAGAGGPPLCVMDDFTYPTTRRLLAPGDWLLAFTDGVTEAMNSQDEFFGIERLRASLSWVEEGARSDQVLARVQRDVAKFAGDAEAADDVTLLALRFTGR
jgi:serine phosphatase RsbU (regulator of sigma subunit)